MRKRKQKRKKNGVKEKKVLNSKIIYLRFIQKFEKKII